MSSQKCFPTSESIDHTDVLMEKMSNRYQAVLAVAKRAIARALLAKSGKCVLRRVSNQANSTNAQNNGRGVKGKNLEQLILIK